MLEAGTEDDNDNDNDDKDNDDLHALERVRALYADRKMCSKPWASRKLRQ